MVTFARDNYCGNYLPRAVFKQWCLPLLVAHAGMSMSAMSKTEQTRRLAERDNWGA